MGLYILLITILTFIGVFLYAIINSGYPIYRNMGIGIVLLAGAVSCAFVLESGHFNSFKELLYALILMIACLTAISVCAYYFTSRHLQKARNYQTDNGAASPVRLQQTENRKANLSNAAPSKRADGRQSKDVPIAKDNKDIIEGRAQRVAAISTDNDLHQQRLAYESNQEMVSAIQSPEALGEILVKPPLASERNANDDAALAKKTQQDQNRLQRPGVKPGSVEVMATDHKKENADNVAAESEQRNAQQTLQRRSFSALLENEKKRLEAEPEKILAMGAFTESQGEVSDDQRIAKRETPVSVAPLSKLLVSEQSVAEEALPAQHIQTEQAAELTAHKIESPPLVERDTEESLTQQTDGSNMALPSVQSDPQPQETVPGEAVLQQPAALEEQPTSQHHAEDQTSADEPIQTNVQEEPVEPTSAPAPVLSKQQAVLAKAVSLMKETRYLIALQLLCSVSFEAEGQDTKKQSDMLTLECMLQINDYARAQKKVFDVLNAKYSFDTDERARIKQIMLLLKSQSGGQGA